MIVFKELASILKNNNSFLITTHVNPDADAIGSEIALYNVLLSLNKKVCIINHSETPYNLKFLDKDNIIEKFNPDKNSKLLSTADVLVCVDFNRANRVVSMEKYFRESNKLKICIDHHQNPENFVDSLFIDPSYSSTGEIIYDLVEKTKLTKFSLSIANPLYAAIMTDTGSFRFDRTTPKIHRIAAKLLELGVNPTEVYDKIYDQSKFSKIRLLGAALNSLVLEGGKNKIGYMILTRKLFKETKALESDTDGFVNYALSVEGVKIGLIFIELNNGFKVSFRSKGNIPVNKLAEEFGGGGHTNAAGSRLFDKKLDDYLPLILKKAKQYLKNYEDV